MTLQEWLESHGCYDVSPVVLTIGRTTYEGCRYRKRIEALQNARTREPYVREAIYVLGGLPAAYRRSTKVAFRFTGDDRDWYVGGYVTEAVATSPDTERFHYEGYAAFQLFPWDASDGLQIDSFEEHPYRRIEVAA
jgi:hypothetical protein